MAAFRQQIKAILIDLSGTLHIENNELPGAIEALKRLRNTNVHIKFVTNTTKESRRCLHSRLIGLGFEIEENEIFSSVWAARDLVASRKLNPLLLLDKDAMDDFHEISNQDTPMDAVVVGLAPDKFNYEDLNKAFLLLTTKGTPLIAIHKGRYYKRPEGLALGPGPFVEGLEYAAECKSEVVGKPTATFFRAALGDIAPGDAVMIGDDVRDDIGGAQALGMRGILVQTGKYRAGDEGKISPEPFRVCPSFALAVESLFSAGEL